MSVHPSHVCLECGCMVSSVHEWTQIHYRWHEEVADLRVVMTELLPTAVADDDPEGVAS